MSDFNSLVQYTVENISRPVKYIIYKLTEFIRVVDKFVFRQVPSGAASGYATIEQIEGNTVVWNQLLRQGKLVDMGLPSGLLWATCNIDITQDDGFAASPFQYGCTMFSWGNIEGHNTPAGGTTFDYNWGSVNAQEPWYEGQVYGSTPGNTLTADIVAGDTYDSARYNLGSLFKMPTSTQFKELFDNCDFVQADGTTVITSTDKRVTVNGILGIYLKSKVNGNLIFFSASGDGIGSSWNNRGSNGYYWSASFLSARFARDLYFNSGGVYPQDNFYRYYGFAIRAVVNPNTIDIGHNSHKYYVTENVNHDLTAIFRAGNEPTTVADFEAWMAQNGLPSVADYNAGELLSVKMSGMQTNTSKLPLGYQELEYLESTGTQYINTEVYITSNKLEISAKVAFTGGPNRTTESDLWGNQDGTTGRIILGYSIYDYWFLYTRYGSATQSEQALIQGDNSVVNISAIVDGSEKWITLNGVSTEHKVATTISNTNRHIQIFTNGNNQYFFIGKLYHLIVVDNDIKTLEIIPAKRLSDNVLGMYDTVSNTFFTNAGTGTFIGGPEVHLDTLPFDVTTITGINSITHVREVIFPDGMKSAKNITDVIDLANGTAIKKLYRVNLGNYNYSYDSQYAYFQSYDDIIIGETMKYTSNFTIQAPYFNNGYNNSDSRMANAPNYSAYKRYQNGRLYIKNTNYTNGYALKTSLNGVYLIAERQNYITYTDLQDANGNPLNPRYKVEQGGTEQILPANTSTPTTVAPTLTTTYTKDVH